ncbi:MAG: hypothetical protein ACYC26_12660 [Phycisphaerales bacterium]
MSKPLPDPNVSVTGKSDSEIVKDAWRMLPPLRQYWQEINRRERQAKTLKRVKQKARDKRRKPCTCGAYSWPHRQGGGLCRYPEPPVECWQATPGRRAYRKRYAGLRRQIARANDLHPIRDRAAIEDLMPRTLVLAKELHRQRPQYKYRNIEITDRGITGYWTTAGPTM